ncbi:hypothetical protein [Paenibacillus peoriae]|uniref:hypothetical protein n=1 Tax=Paenibacillus peoriae TaxID=59893 RepID=UPI00215B2AC3|nr:hypothetical protein [Paenibacillus peoriae]
MSSNKEISKIVNQLREKGERVTLLAFLREAQSQGLLLSVDDIAELAWTTEQSEILVPPPLVRKTISSFIARKTYQKVLDPWDRFGGLIRLAKPDSERHSILYNAANQEMFSTIDGNAEIETIVGNPLETLDKYDDQWDLIISCPPFGMKREKIMVKIRERVETIVDPMELLILFQACTKLNQKGTALFVVLPRFFESATYLHLSSIGIHPEAIVHFPPGTFGPYTQISTYMVVLRRVDASRLTFIAEIGSEDDIQPVLHNMAAGKEGKTLERGTFIDPNSFSSFKALQLARDIRQLSRRMNLTPVTLTSITKEINLSNDKWEEGFKDLPNTVYLPRFGESDAVARLSDLRLKSDNYMQIVLDSEKANAEYVARFFCAEMGQLIRKYISKGHAFTKISLSSLKECEVYFPSVETQTMMNDAQNEITELRAMLYTIEQQLWNKPNDVEKTMKSLKRINRESGFESWMETLPFPIASILWRYNAESNVRLKKEHLFHFFEAMTQFNTMLLLSGLKSESSLLDSHRDTVFADFKKESLYRSTFGTWIVLGERISKIIRTEMGTQDRRERCLKAFRSGRPDLINFLSSKKTFEVLKRTADFRNRWKGHGGIENEQEAKKRLSVLESELAALRELMIDTYEGYQIICPENGTRKSGIFHMKVYSIMGTRQIFKKISIQSTFMQDSEKLYLYFEGNPEPLELLPFIKFKLGQSPDENACYFYNSVEKSGVRWISYHFDKEAEFIEADAVLGQMLDTLI